MPHVQVSPKTVILVMAPAEPNSFINSDVGPSALLVQDPTLID